MTTSSAHGIAEVAELTGLSRDTLRWYEREGLIPGVGRDSAGRRRYDDALIRMVHLLARLRRTGMPVAEMKQFVALLEFGAASHSQASGTAHPAPATHPRPARRAARGPRRGRGQDAALPGPHLGRAGLRRRHHRRPEHPELPEEPPMTAPPGG